MPSLLFFTTPSGYVDTDQDPSDPSGKPTLELIKARDRGESLAGLPVPTRYRLKTLRKMLPDAFVVYSGFRVISEGFRSAISGCILQACEFYPVDVQTKKGERAFSQFYIMHIRNFKDSIIEEKTDFRVFDHEYFGRSLSIYPHLHAPQPMALDRSAQESPDLWRERREPFHIYASDKLVAACKDKRLKGLYARFVPIEDR